MRRSATHYSCDLPFQLGGLINKRRALIGQLRCRFADNDNIQDDGLLRFLVGQKVFLGKTFDVTACKPDGIKHVFEIILLTQLFLSCVHTGTASLRTWSRNFAGKSPGVSTSTAMPSASSSST